LGQRAEVMLCDRLIGTLLSAALTAVVRGCSLCTPQRSTDGPVFELTTDSLDAAAERHDLLVLLLYNGGSLPSKPDQQTVNAKSAYSRTAGRLLKAFNDPYLDPAILDPELRASLAVEVTDTRHTVMLAQLDANEHPLAAHRLGVHSQELPALRMLRGDATYGYKIRGPSGDFVTRTGRAVFDELKAARSPAVRLTAPAEPLPAVGGELRLLGELHSSAKACVFQQVKPPSAHPWHPTPPSRTPWDPTLTIPPRPPEQVAHAFRKPDEPSVWPPVTFALHPSSSAAAVCTSLALQPRPSSPPSAPKPDAHTPASRAAPLPPPIAPPAAHAAAAADAAVPADHILMYDAPGALSMDARSTLVMPLHGGGARLSAQRLHRWVHWAALPKVAQIADAKGAATYLREVPWDPTFTPQQTSTLRRDGTCLRDVHTHTRPSVCTRPPTSVCTYTEQRVYAV
jgi:hypothetical protein